jgi:hypothetical protein
MPECFPAGEIFETQGSSAAPSAALRPVTRIRLEPNMRPLNWLSERSKYIPSLRYSIRGRTRPIRHGYGKEWKMKASRSLVLLGLLVSATATGADTHDTQLLSSADGQEKQAIQDTFSNGIKPDTNFGYRKTVVVRTWGPNHGYVQFEMDDLGPHVESATLVMSVLEVREPGTIWLYQVMGPWEEDLLTFNWAPTRALLPFASLTIGSDDAGGQVSVDVTSIVQLWADGADNFGIALVASDRANVVLGSIEGGDPMWLHIDAGAIECPEGTLLEPYTAVCAPVNDISNDFAGAANSSRQDSVTSMIDMSKLPVPGGYGVGTRYAPDSHRAMEHAVFHTRMFVQPDGVGAETSDWTLMTPATNHTDSATEFVGIYRSHLEDGWWGIFGRPCTEEYPCPDGDTANGWQAGWNHPFSDFPAYVTDFQDKGGHAQKIIHYANETVKLDDGSPPLWRNAIYLWNFSTDQWDLIWRHEYRELKRDCSVEGCSNWGPILETVGVQGEINELGYDESLLFHDGTWSSLSPSTTTFVMPISPWVLDHHEPNAGFGVGNRFVEAGPQSLEPIGDAFVNGALPDERYGDAGRIVVASWAPKIGFAKFDLEALAANSFDSAILNLIPNLVRHAGDMEIHVVYQDWDEASITFNSMPAYDPTPVATLAVNDDDIGKALAVDLTNLVRQWAEGSVANHGIALVPSNQINVRMDSREAGSDEQIIIRIQH